MPIKPENRARYPKEWPLIRVRILKRAKDCCEECGVGNRARISRSNEDQPPTYLDDKARVWSALARVRLGNCRMSDWEGKPWITVVLTIAHMENPDPEDCRDENLKALCQRCHLGHDRYRNLVSAIFTRRKRKALGDLFGGAYR